MAEINVIPENYEGPSGRPLPFECPFILSSVEKDWCRFQQNRTAAIVFIKRRHLEENLKTFAGEIGMGDAERARFLDHWCSPSSRDPETIRAELDECFNLRLRAEWWMESRRGQKQVKSRIERYAESAQNFFNNNATKAETIPPGLDDLQGFGYADIPDEQ